MLFLSEEVLEKRRALIRRMESGELPREEAGRQMLELVPDDAFACYVSGVGCFERDDFEAARELFWRAIRLQPAHSMGYVGLSNALQRSGADPELTRSLTPLALRRMLHNPDQAELVEEKWLARMRETLGPDIDKDLSLAAIDALSVTTKDEPQRVTELLQPYRQLQEIIDRPEKGIAKATVDAILADGPVFEPLLVGVLRGYARSDSEPETSAEAALALLGESGGPDILPVVLEFREDEDAGVAEAALFAANRLVARHPQLAESAPGLETLDVDLSVYDFCCYDDTPYDEEFDEDQDEEDDYDEEEEEPAAPKPGRNDPCWCGSGKKYKKCHLAEDEAAEREAGTLAEPLLEFARDWISRDQMETALATFTGSADQEPDEDTEVGFFDWLLHDYMHPRLGRTIPQEFARRHGPSPELRDWMEARFSLFEVLRTDPEKDLIELQDLLFGGTLPIEDHTTSRSAAAGDWLLVRVQQDAGRRVPSSPSEPVPTGYREDFRSWLTAEQAGSGQDWTAWLRANSHRLRLKLLEMGAAYRESLITANFEVLDEPALHAALEAAPEIKAAGEGYDWIEPDETRRLLGKLNLEPGRLTLRCTSHDLRARGIETIERIAGPSVRKSA